MVGTGDDIERTLTIADELEQAAQTDATSNTTLALSAEDTSKSQEEIASETTDAQTETPSQDSTSTTTDTSTNTNVSSSSDTSRLQPATSTEESDQDISSENGELSDDPTTWPDDKLVDTPAGRITMGEVREYARIRDEQIADLESRIGGGKSKVAKTNTLSLTANSSNTSFSFYQHWKNGGIYVRLINEGPYSDTFDVMRDGEWYIGYCLDEGLPAPPDGTYSFWAEYDPSDGGFWITVDCAWPEEDQIELPEGQEWTGEGCQRVGEFKIFFGGKYRTQKVSADGSISNVKTYSYAGAKFGVYSSYDNFLADEGLVGTDGNHADFIVTTGEDGYSSFVATSVGEYYIRELEAPPGFKRKTDGWGVDVYVDLTVDEGTGGPTTDTVSDEPIYDPVGIGLQKTKSDGSAYYGKDGNKVKLGGAVYEFAYYDSLFYSKASIPSSATRTWHLQTDSNGLVELKHADTQMVSGYGANSELFLAGGKPFIPFGTLVIKEVAAPDGYKLSSEVFIATMRPANNSDGYEWVFNGADFDSNAIIADEATDTGSLVIKKKSTNTSISHAVSALTSDIFNYTLAGAVFAVYNNAACSGTPIATLKTNANGVTSELKNLAPYGTFYVKEITPPNGFSLPTNTARVKAVVVKPGAQGTTYFEYTDEPVYAPADIEVNKVDADGNTTQGDATLKDAEYTFSFYYGTKSAIGTPTAQWVLKTDDEGRVSLSDADDPARLVSHTGTEWRVGGNLVLPLGTLVVQETKAPVGYYLSEATYTNTLVYDTETATAVWSSEGDFSDTSAIIDQEAPKKFGISLYKEIQGVENEASLEGIQFEVYLEESDGTETLKDTLTLDETGKAQSAEDAYYLGTYKVYEIEDTLPRDESGNYLIQPYSYTSGTGSNLVATVDQHDDDTYTDMKVIDITCTDYTTETFDSEKKDKDTGKPIADTEFTLHKYTGDIGMDDGAVTLDPATLDARGEYWEEIEVLTTDTHGVVSFENKLYGIYMLVETKANYHYLNASETDRELASADPLDSARIFTIDKNTPATLQTWEDELIQVETTIDKSTIDVTSIGLISKSQSENGVNLTNVGAETYRYDVAFSSGKTNTFADEFWMVDELNMVASPFDLRVTKIYLPTVQNDTAPTVHLLIRTNKSTKDTWDATPVVTKEKEAYHQFSLCDGSSRFVGTGWRYVGEYSSVESTSIDIASLKLAKGEYITGLCLYYGAVEEGFTTVNPLSYDVTATHELLVSTIIPNSAISHISRNWANRNGEDGGLQDDDEDNVVTTVITTFEM